MDKEDLVVVKDDGVIDLYPDTLSGRKKAREQQAPKDDWFEQSIRKMEEIYGESIRV